VLSNRPSVLVLPVINTFAFEEDTNGGDSVQVICHVAKGDLPLEVRWLFKGKPISSILRIMITKIGDKSSLLSIPSVSAEHIGQYTCLASNRAGEAKFSADLNVKGTKIFKV
jgi:Immunoglobulin domain